LLSILKSDYAQNYYWNFLNELNNGSRNLYDINGGAFLDNEFNLHIQIKADDDVVKTLQDKYATTLSLSYSKFSVYVDQVKFTQEQILNAYNLITNSELATNGLISEVYTNYEINGIEIKYSPNIIGYEEILLALEEIPGDFSNYRITSSDGEYHAEPKYNIYGGAKLETYGIE
jgi:hypothetical protein